VTTAPADLTLVADAPGYVELTQAVAIPGDARVVTNIDLTRTPASTATVVITAPADGLLTQSDSVDVLGYTAGFEVVGVTVNGVDATLADSGQFKATVPLEVGD